MSLGRLVEENAGERDCATGGGVCLMKGTERTEWLMRGDVRARATRVRRVGKGSGRAPATGRLRRAWTRVRSPWAGMQALLCGMVAAAGVLWLELPDGTAGERVIAATVLVIAGALAVWAQAAILIAARRPVLQRAAWRGAVWLLGLGIGYWLVVLLFEAGALQDGSRAAYLEQRTFLWHVASLRELLWMEAGVWWALRWALAGAMLPLVMEGVAVGRKGVSWRRCTAPMRAGLYWATMLGLGAVWTAAEAGVLLFRPVISVMVQVALSAGKMGLLFALGVGGGCFAVSLTGTYLRDVEREQGGRSARLGQARSDVSGARVLSAS